MTHMLPESMPSWGTGSRAYWALEPNGDVIVFVHGFGGSAVHSWSQFDVLLPEIANHDVVFYGYDSFRLAITVAARELGELLDSLFVAGAMTVNGTIERELYRDDQKFVVRRVLLVGHSVGAVICRRTLLDAANAGALWVDRVKLVLFAPAHMGTDLMCLWTSLAGSFRVPLDALVKFRIPILREIERGSQVLNDLRSSTKEAMHDGGRSYLRAVAIAICEIDRVVVPDPFCPADELATVIPRTTHRSICKPNENYSRPLEIIRGCL